MERELVVQERQGSTFSLFVERWTKGVMRFARWVLLAWTLVTLGALLFAVNNLGLDADVANMVSAELPVRKALERYRQAFPQYEDLMVLVVEGNTPEYVENAAAALASRLRRNESLFQSVYLPGAGAFFETHALLYLSLDELQELADQMAAAQPILGKLTADFSLRGLFKTLSTVIENADKGEIVNLAPVLNAVNATLRSAVVGEDPPSPLSWRAVLQGKSADERVTRRFILVQPRPDYSTLFPVAPAIAAVRDAAKQTSIDGARGLRLRITGGLALEHEEMQTVTKGAGLALALALLLVTATLFVAFGSLRMIVASLLTLIAGLVVTAAFAAAAIGHLNMISIAFAVLNIGLGIDFAIHFCMGYQEVRRHKEPPARRLIRTAKHVVPSLGLCAITTAAGFYAFLPTPYVGVGELGVIAGTGVFISLLASLTLLPALLHLWQPPSRSRAAVNIPLPKALVELPLRHRRGVLTVGALVAVAAGVLLPSARFDYNPLNLRDPEAESVVTFKALLEESDYSPLSAVVLASGKKALAAIGERLQNLTEVKDALSIDSFVPEQQLAKLEVIEELSLILGPELSDVSRPTGTVSVAAQREAMVHLLTVLGNRLASDGRLSFDEAARTLQVNLQTVLQHLGSAAEGTRRQWLEQLEQALLGTLPENLERLRAALMAEPFGVEDLPSALVQRWVSDDGLFRIEVVPQEDILNPDALRRFVSAIQQVAPDVTGEPVQMVVVGDTIIDSFKQAFVFACVTVTAIVMVGLRSISGALLVIVTLLFGAMITGAILVLIGIPFNFANVIALPLLLGMGVDNGIHLLRRLRASGDRSKLTVMHSSTPRAMLFSALTTIASFGNLSFSGHPGTASLGVVLVIGIVVMLLSTLSLVPALHTARGFQQRSVIG
jgi:hopanoid biosynthesis associated RND transporter like protein HpnN